MTGPVRISVTRIPEIIRERGSLEGELWTQLRAAGFTGRLYDATAMELAAVGRHVLLGLIYGGGIHRALREIGRPLDGLAQAVRDMTHDEVEHLVHLTVAQGLRLFTRNALDGYGWQPGGTTRMDTYFVNTCKLCFPNAFREAVNHGRPKQELPVASMADDEAGVTTLDAAERPGTLREAMAENGIQGVQAIITQMTVDGFTQVEIAEQLETTPRAVEGKLRRIREKLRKRRHP